jgi:hypothetical protein
MHLHGDFTGALGETVEAPRCAALPSGQAAAKLVAGDWEAIVPVIGYTAVRGALIAVGLAVAGEREHIVRNAISGTLAIETFVLGWAAIKEYGK